MGHFYDEKKDKMEKEKKKRTKREILYKSPLFKCSCLLNTLWLQ